MKLLKFILICGLPLITSAQSTNSLRGSHDNSVPGNESNASGDMVEPVYPLIEFSVFVWSDMGIMSDSNEITGLPRLYYERPDGNTVQIRLNRNKSTALMPYQGPSPLLLFDFEGEYIQPPAGSPPGTQPIFNRKRIPKFKVEIPEELRRLMVIIFPGRRDTDGYMQTLVLPYDSEKLTAGMSRILNGTNRTLALKLEDNDRKILRINPNEMTDFNPRDYTDENYPRFFIYGVDEQQQLRLLHTNKFNIKEDRTSFYIIIPEGTRRVRVKKLGSHELGNFAIPTTASP